MEYGPVRFFVADLSEGIPCIVEGPFATEDKAFHQTIGSRHLHVLRVQVQKK